MTGADRSEPSATVTLEPGAKNPAAVDGALVMHGAPVVARQGSVISLVASVPGAAPNAELSFVLSFRLRPPEMPTQSTWTPSQWSPTKGEAVGGPSASLPLSPAGTRLGLGEGGVGPAVGEAATPERRPPPAPETPAPPPARSAGRDNWQMALCNAAANPGKAEGCVFHNDEVLVLRDKYPKARFHYLVLSRTRIEGPADLTSVTHPLRRGRAAAPLTRASAVSIMCRCSMRCRKRRRRSPVGRGLRKKGRASTRACGRLRIRSARRCAGRRIALEAGG